MRKKLNATDLILKKMWNFKPKLYVLFQNVSGSSNKFEAVA